MAADTTSRSGRVLTSFGGDLTLPAGEQADAVIVVDGTATILGDAKAVVAINGRAELRGATVESIVAIGSPVVLGAGTTVSGDVYALDSTVDDTSGAVVAGEVKDVAPSLIAAGVLLAPVLFLLFIGLALVTIAAGLVLAAIAARQVRAAETLISREPGRVFVVGLAGLIVPILLFIGLLITVVGAPLGFAILIFAWPLVGYLGYLVTGIWIGDWIVARMQPGVVHDRPYLAAVIGLIVLQATQLIPAVAGIASLFGYGAVILLAWRTFRSQPGSQAGSRSPSAAPMPG